MSGLTMDPMPRSSQSEWPIGTFDMTDPPMFRQYRREAPSWIHEVVYRPNLPTMWGEIVYLVCEIQGG